MKTFAISNLGSKGLNTDVQPWELPLEFITDGRNFRSRSGSIEAVPDSKTEFTPVTNFNAGFVLYAGLTSGSIWLIAGRDAVYAYDGATYTDISSTIGYASLLAGDEFLWNGCLLGNIPILNNPLATVEYRDPVTGQLLPLDFSPGVSWTTAVKSFKVIRSHKNFLFALNLVEDGNELPSSYRWSHPADNNGLPFTWDETDTSSIASIEQLGGDTGEIVDGLTMRDAFVIYSERGIDILDQGGDFIFRRRRLSSTVGLISKDCVVEVNGSHYFLGDGDIYINNGNQVQSIAHDFIRTRLNLNGNADFYDRAFLVKNTSHKEVWVFAPENGAETPNIAYVYHWLDKTWSLQDVPKDTAFAGYGFKSDNSSTLTWETINMTWDEATASGIRWNQGSDNPLGERILSVNNVDSSITTVNPREAITTDTNTIVERQSMPVEGIMTNVSVMRCYPKITGDPVEIQIGSHQSVGSQVRWGDTIVFTPGVDKKIDVRATGELISYRVKSIGNGLFRLSGFEFSYVSAGIR